MAAGAGIHNALFTHSAAFPACLTERIARKRAPEMDPENWTLL